MIVKCPHPLTQELVAIVRDELNVKDVAFSDDVDAYLSYAFKPQLKTCGPKFGKLLGELKAALASLDGTKAKKELDTAGTLALDLPSGRVVLEPEDLLISTQQKDGFFAVQDGELVVALDTTLTEELIREGFVNEIISKVQTMRKDADFVVTDRIELGVSGNEMLEKLIKETSEEICRATLTERITDALSDNAKAWDINGEKVTLSVKVIG